MWDFIEISDVKRVNLKGNGIPATAFISSGEIIIVVYVDGTKDMTIWLK